jgi:hypothetical protein
MKSKHKTAMGLAIIAGILLFIEGISGLATWQTIRNFVIQYIADNEIIQIIFAVLIFIASLGGISVIIGGLLIGKEKLITGRFLIMLGAGLGLIGLIITIIISITHGSFTLGGFLTIGVIGLILSIIARMLAK